MKSFSKKLLGLTFASIVFGSIGSAWAAAPISFDGPKITNEQVLSNGTKVPLVSPEDFSLPYQFKGTPFNDVAVPLRHRGGSVTTHEGPLVLGNILGLENLNNWADIINKYFTQHNVVLDQDLPLQLINGHFNGAGGTVDLAVIASKRVHVCFDYAGNACASVYSLAAANLPGMTDPIRPWTGAVGDIDGDGKDDLVYVGYTHDPSGGYLGAFVHYKGTGDQANPFPSYVSYQLDKGLPLSVALGKYDNSGKLSAAIGMMPSLAGAKAWVNFAKNNGSGFDAPVAGSSPVDACYQPTGLFTYNPDANGNDDLVMTCYRSSDAVVGTGSVITLKSDPAAPSLFNPKQVLSNFKGPYSSTVADYNGDSKPDLAVADNTGMAVVTIPGGADPFSFDEGGMNVMNVSPYTPKFIKTAEMNGADSDLVVTAAKVRLPSRYVSLDIKSDSYEMISMAPSAAPGYYMESISSVSYSNNCDAYTKKSLKSISPNNFEYNDIRSTNRFYRIPLVESTELRDTAYAAYAPASVAPLCPSDAVLVFLNYRPQISVEDPNCKNGSKVVVHCTPSDGHTIDSCIVTPEGSWSPNSQVTPNGNGKDVTITLPSQATPVTYTVTATEAAPGNTYTMKVTQTPAQCETNLSVTCSQSIRPVANVYWDDEWTVCLPDNMSAQAANRQVVWSQTAGPNIMNSSNNIVAQSVAASGSCISGRFNPLTEENFTVSLNYSIVDPVTGQTVMQGCGADIKFFMAALSGDSQGAGKCSISRGHFTFQDAWMGSSLLLLPALVFVTRRKRQVA